MLFQTLTPHRSHDKNLKHLQIRGNFQFCRITYKLMKKVLSVRDS